MGFEPMKIDVPQTSALNQTWLRPHLVPEAVLAPAFLAFQTGANLSQLFRQELYRRAFRLRDFRGPAYQPVPREHLKLRWFRIDPI